MRASKMMTGFSFLCDILRGSILFLCISVTIAAAHAPGLAFSADAEIMNWLWSSQSITINIIHFNAVIPHTHGKWFRHTYLRKKHCIHTNLHINKHGYEDVYVWMFAARRLSSNALITYRAGHTAGLLWGQLPAVHVSSAQFVLLKEPLVMPAVKKTEHLRLDHSLATCTVC